MTARGNGWIEGSNRIFVENLLWININVRVWANDSIWWNRHTGSSRDIYNNLNAFDSMKTHIYPHTQCALLLSFLHTINKLGPWNESILWIFHAIWNVYSILTDQLACNSKTENCMCICVSVCGNIIHKSQFSSSSEVKDIEKLDA